MTVILHVVIFMAVVSSCLADSGSKKPESEPRCVEDLSAVEIRNVRDYNSATILVKLLHHQQSWIREAALYALKCTPNTRVLISAIPDIIKAWETEQSCEGSAIRDLVTESATQAIGIALQKGKEKTIPYLIKAFDAKKQLTKKFLINIILENMSGNEVLFKPVFEELMKDSDPEIRKAVVFSLKRYCSRDKWAGFLMAGRLADSDSRVRKSAALYLVDMDISDSAKACSDLVKLLFDPDEETRLLAVRVLEKFREQHGVVPSINELRDILNAEDVHVIIYAVESLAYLKKEDAVTILLTVLQNTETIDSVDKEENFLNKQHCIKNSIFKVLPTINNKDALIEAVPVLTKILAGNYEYNFKEAAAKTLANAGEYGVPYLVQYWLKDADENMFCVTGSILIQTGQAGIAALIEALRKANEGEQKKIVALMLTIKDKTAIPLIMEGLKAKEAVVRKRAHYVLRKLTGRSFDAVYTLWWLWWEKDKDIFEMRWY